MKIKIELDGNFTSDQHNELNKLSIIIDWKLNIFPEKDDYIDLVNFTNKLPNFANKAMWKVLYRDFVNHDKISLYLIYLD